MWGDIQFASYYGFDPVVVGLLIKINRPVHIAVVGNGNSRHFILSGLLEKVVETNSAVKKAVLGMYVKMDKVCVLHDKFTPYLRL